MRENADLIIVGSGMAATRLVETLRRSGDRRSIILLGEERALPYNRIMLSPLLAGEVDWQQLIAHEPQWYQQMNVELRLGRTVAALDAQRRRVRCADGEGFHYGELVLATGARAARPALPGAQLRGVTGFRNIDDVHALRQAASANRNAVVLGGGLLGLEAAVALAIRGMGVTLVHRSAQLMNRQLDALAADYLRRAIEDRGVEVRTGLAPVAMLGDEVVRGVSLENGEILAADIVVFAAGITPETTLARAAGLVVNRGIVVDRGLRTSAASVYALGECCELDGETVGLVAPIWQQVDVLAANLCGGNRAFVAQLYVTKLKVSGIDVHVMGDLQACPDTRVLTFQDRKFGIYKKLLLRNDKVVGALLFGDVVDSSKFFSLIQNQCVVDGANSRLLLAGEHSADATRVMA